MKLTADRLRELLNYYPNVGLFARIKRHSTAPVHAGDIAGYKKKDGYRYIKIDGRAYLEHRLAWLWMTGGWPKDEVDHIDCNKSNNAWRNLRAASHSQNIANSKPRRPLPKGVYKTTNSSS